MTQALAEAGCEVTLVLKAPVRTPRLVDPLTRVPGVTVVRPHEEGLLPDLGERLTPEQAVALLARMDAERPFDLVVVRGSRLAERAAAEESLRGRLWTYLTDVPQTLSGLTPDAVAGLTAIAHASRYLLCQTEELRCFLEQAVPAACGKCVLFPPVVVLPEGVAGPGQADDPLTLVYTGKFAPAWNTLEMTELPGLLGDRGVRAELHMIGDKIHGSDRDWAKKMRVALESTPGVVWHGGHSREDALRMSAQRAVGLSWRAPELDASLELSTKVLELGALGLPVVLNRTPMHERLLGADYPLYAGADATSVADVLARARDPQVYRRAADACARAAADFTLGRAAERLRGYLDRALPALSGRNAALPSEPLKVVVAGHELKFFTRLLEHLRSLPGVEVRLDQWTGFNDHDEPASRALADWADVVICEWCGPNAVYYARHKRPGQRLLVRLHRFELYSEWPKRLAVEKVDAVICVSPHYAELTRRRTGWPAEKVLVVPNWVDTEQLDRPKLPDAEYALGIIGIAPSRKRLDRALDVLERLRRTDPRFMLHVKSKLPWEYWWIWKRSEERAYFERVFRRIQRSPELSGAVVFDPFGPDVAVWLRRIGFVLSTSDDESFHLAPAEGMASGAVPVVLAWPGADTIYDDHWVHADTDQAAAAIADTVRGGRFDAERELGREQVRAAYALEGVCDRWTELVRGTAPAAAARA
ncbi:glycosyltransferase [Allonocardiopsis opalescens]|nr:glycosyltransferase [Allonocardiopsis opalescens]